MPLFTPSPRSDTLAAGLLLSVPVKEPAAPPPQSDSTSPAVERIVPAPSSESVPVLPLPISMLLTPMISTPAISGERHVRIDAQSRD